MKAKCERTVRIFVCCSLCLAGAVSTGWSDCGSIPFEAVVTTPLNIVETTFDSVVEGSSQLMQSAPRRPSKLIQFDPLAVTVFEPRQRAIILWNGHEEILLLSTDQRASRQSAVLEVIPLPSQPTIRLGSFQTFEEAQRLVVQKRMWAFAHGGARAGAASLPASAGRITFQQKLGAHNLAVAEALDTTRFVEYVQDFLERNYKTADAPIRPEFVRVIESYLNEGFRWFAFDVIALDTSTKSREPVEYRFRSSTVFYPLRISSLEGGRTQVDHLIFTPRPLDTVKGPTDRLRREPAVTLTRQEVESLDEKWRDFFGVAATSVVLNQWSIEGESSRLLTDVRAK